MKESNGLFQVIDDITKDVLGTAFSLTQANNANHYYVITAYHVVAELIARNRKIIIRDINMIYHSVRMLTPQLDLESYCHPGKDYAIFELVTSIQYNSFFPGSNVGSTTPCYIRGAGLHFRTVFTRIKADVLGIEKENNEDVLCIQMPVRSYDNNSLPIRDQDVLRGMSGSPIVVTNGSREECIGVLSNAGSDETGFIRYAVPISTVLSDSCLLLSDPIAFQQDLYDDFGLIINILFEDDPNDFIFYNEAMDQMMWKKISNWFFRGIPIDDKLRNILTSEEITSYSAEVQMALYYYYSRLLYKRGQVDSGQTALYESLSLEKKVSQRSKEKIAALANGRLLIENNKIFKKAEQVRYAGFSITEIPDASESYIAYETASLYGKGMINLFSFKDEFSSYEKEDIKKIYKEQLQLFNGHKDVLARQDVVITAVEWYIGLWEIDSSLKDAFEITIRKGFRQCEERKNDIFHLQSLIAYGIYLLQNNHNVRAMTILTLCSMLMRNLRIFPGHEGIAQLFRFLKTHYRREYAALHIIYSSSIQSEVLSKLDILYSGFRNIPWKTVLEYASWLFKDLYLRYLDLNTKAIYHVKLNDIEVRLLN